MTAESDLVELDTKLTRIIVAAIKRSELACSMWSEDAQIQLGIEIMAALTPELEARDK